MTDTGQKPAAGSVTLDCGFAVIACSICKELSEVYIGHSVSEFVAMLEADGWRRINGHGWICFAHDASININTNKD